MRITLEGSLKAGEQLTRTAERLLDADRPVVELPKYVQELSEAAKFKRGAGDPNLYEQAVKRWHNQVSRLGQGAELQAGEYTIQSATRELVRRLGKAKPDQVDTLVERWVLERARYQARVIARHESVEAARESALSSYREQDWVHGVRWTLSPSHPRPDICDMHAGVDLYGLGAGGYPLDKVPGRHPSCMCNLVPISDEAHFERKIAKAKGNEEPARKWLSGRKESAEDWLKTQAKELRQAIIGPTREKLLERGRKVFDEGASGFRPVYKLLGKQKPQIQRGPRIDARGVIAKDRASMVKPFPTL